MKRLDNKLKVSVSLLALMSGGALIASTAHAVTISGAQNSVVITTDISDLIVDSTGDVSPGGILVQGAVAGAVTNNGIIEFIDTPTAGDADSVDADAVGLEVWGDIGGNFSNTKTILATADATVSVIGDFSGDVSIAEDAPSGADAFASGVSLDDVKGDFSNTGSITADAKADASSDITADSAKGSSHIDGGSYSNAEAYGVEGILDKGDFTNAKGATIKATASASSDVIADVSGTTATLFDVDGVDSYAFAMGVDLDGGGDAISNAGTIAAGATASSVFDGTATSSTGNGTIGGEDFGADSYATSIGLYIGDDATSLSNTGTVTADAKASGTMTAVADGAVNAVIVGEDNVHANAYGIEVDGGLTSFTNSGPVTVTGASTLAVNATATGDKGANVSLDNEVGGETYGVIIDALDGPFSNSAAISSTNTADLKVVADAGSADVASGTASVASFVKADARGVQIDDFDGSFTNTKDGKITASASATSSVDLGATGAKVAASDGVSITETVTMANAIGVALDGGEDTIEDPDTNTVTNAGTISATANAKSTVVASGTSTGTDASGVGVSEGLTGALAMGLLDMGDATGFDNSGTITAAATASHTATLTGDGLVDSAGVNDSILYAAAVGAAFVEPIDGNVTNSGTISATATGTYDVDLASDDKADLGDISSINQAGVAAVGLYADIEAPVDSKDVASTFTNSGTISATIAATNVDSATAIGVSLSEAAAGLEIVNSGTIKADITGSAEDSVAIALMVGPLAESEDTLIASLSQTTTATSSGTTLMYASGGSAVITVTNSGTISATNATGVSVGIGGLTSPAPLVINQQGGSISAEIAIELDQGNADTLNWTGGAIHGIVSADELDVVNVFTGTGTPANKTVTADADFALVGGAALNIGLDDTAVTFSMAGTTSGTGEVNLNKNASLVMQTTGSIGAGTFNMDPVSALTFVFNPTDAGEIVTTGDANIDGVLNALALPGLYGDKGSHVVIATEGEVVGTFDNASINGDTLLLDFTAAVHKQDVTISWKRNAFNSVAGLTINSTSVATALEEGYDTKRAASKNAPELNDVLSAMFTLKDAARYDRVLNSWSGSEHAQVMRAAANLSEPYHMALSEHLNDIRHTGGADGQVVMLRPKGSSTSIAPLSAAGASGGDEKRFEFWGRAFGRWASTRGDVEADGYDEDTFGAVLGGDFQVSSNVTIGLVTGYMDDKLDFDDGDLGKIKRWTIGGYLSATINQFYIDGSLTYASDNYKVNRTIQYGNTSCLAFNCTTGASSKYDGDGLMGHAEVGYLFDLGNGTELRPFAGLNYSTVDTDPFSEAGGGDLGLDILDGTGKSFQSRLGARLSGVWGESSTKWIPELRAEWRHEFKDNPSWIVANLNGLPNDPFVAIGSKVTQDLAVLGAGVTALMSNGVGVFFDYQGAFGSGYHSHAIQGGVRVKF